MTDAGYDPLHVALYDQHADRRGRADVAFYRDLARAADGPALEVACGTGRVYLELLADGLDVDGFDASAPALARLRERAGERGLEPAVWQADASAFAVDRAYDLVYCPFNALQHLLTVDDQLGALERAYDALAHGGTFAFDVFVPSFEFVCEQYGEWTEERVRYDGETHVARRRPRIVDEVAQVFEEAIQLCTPDGEVVDETAQRLTFLPPQQVDLLARQSPFEEWDVPGGFEDEPLEDGASVQVWQLHRTEV